MTTFATADESAVHRWIWRWHGYAGLFVVPFIFYMSLTGIPFVWDQELETALHPEYRALQPQPTRVSYEQQLATACAAMPGRDLTMIQLDGDPRHATGFVFDESDPTTVTVNPYTGKVITVIREWTRLSAAAIMLHGLAMVKPYGSWLIEFLTCWAIVLCFTGLYLWWPRGKHWSIWGVFLPRLGISGRARWRDVHVVGGAYFSVLLILYLGTGLPWTAFWGGRLLGRVEDMTGQSYPCCMTKDSCLVSAPPAPDSKPLPLDAFVEFGLSQRLPGQILIEMPASANGTVHLRNSLKRNVAEKHFQLNVFTAQPVASADWSSLPAVQKAVNLGIDIHEGNLLGFPTQIFSTLLASTFMLLAGAGAVMWWKRRPQGKLDRPRIIATPSLPSFLKICIAVLGIIMPMFGLAVVVIIAVNLRNTFVEIEK